MCENLKAVIEAAAAGVPAVNVGDRQSGRLRASRSVIDSGETTREIRQAIMAALLHDVVEDTGIGIDEIATLTRIDRWFLHNIKEIVEMEEELEARIARAGAPSEPAQPTPAAEPKASSALPSRACAQARL